MKKLILLILLNIFIWNNYSQNFLPLTFINNKNIKCDTIVSFKNYCVSYSFENNLPILIEYQLNPNQSNNLNDFKPLTFKGKLSKNYTNSGFDRGHLYPAEDSSFDYENFQECYNQFNLTPQKPSFNRGVWKKLEFHLRKISKIDVLDIITGPDLYNENLYKINDEISIPNFYFKIVINYSKQEIYIYYISNNYNDLPLENYLISINDFENKCGIIFDKIFINKFKNVIN